MHFFAGLTVEVHFDFAPDAANRDTKDALASLNQVDNLARGGTFVDGGTVTHQGDVRKVVNAAGTQMLDGGANLLQGHAGVEQSLHNLEYEHIAEAVEALGTGSGGATHGGYNQVGACPVVELTVGDADCFAGDGATVTEVFLDDRDRVGEEYTLFTARRRRYGEEGVEAVQGLVEALGCLMGACGLACIFGYLLL